MDPLDSDPFEAYDNCPWRPPREMLADRGFTSPPPDEVHDDRELRGRLWELIYALAAQRFFIFATDHLDDRELYEELWRNGLRAEAILPRKTPRGGWFHDCTGSGSDEHHHLWLRFHAGVEARARHAREYPDEPLPPRETPPHPRDWRLPKGPF